MENNTNLNVENASSYACPSCGANMVFDPETQTLKCPYCENSQEVVSNAGQIKEYDFATAEDSASTNWGVENKIIKCKSCGYEVVIDAAEAATKCSFCGSSYIVSNDESAGIAPESLIPFKISEKTALEMFTKWVKKKWFAPKALKTNYKADKINGVYIPCWTYDAITQSYYTAEVGTYYYVPETYTENGETKTRQVRKTSWRPISGDCSLSFDDVLVNASQKTEGKLMKALEPFELNDLTGYDAKFLSGFAAERYSVSVKDGWGDAKEYIDDYIRSDVRSRVHGDEVRGINISTSYFDVKFKHILLPVWISAYTYKNKVYRYMVNGQTGEVQGHAPVSVLKILTLIGILLVIGILGYCFSGVKG